MSGEDFLSHYGMPRRSGRYPWGSGDNPYQNSKNFLSYVDDLRKQGLSDKEIAKGLGVSTTQLLTDRRIANNQVRAADQANAVRLKDKGYSNVAIGKRMGVNESQVRSLLKQANEGRVNILRNTADQMKAQLETGAYLDVGEGTQLHMGVSTNTKNTAVAMLQDEGYKLNYVKVKQLGTGHETTLKVLAKDDVPYRTIFENQENIKLMNHVSKDGGRSFLGLEDPVNVKSDRIAVRYADEGGVNADGTLYVRPGVKDLDLGGSSYAQVRIAVDGTHYLKGVAIPKEGLPDGVDIVFNTNKDSTGNKLDAMKPMKKLPGTNTIDPDNPFGSAISRQQGAMNIVNEEGDWEDWSRNLSSQMLSKQSVALAKRQLDTAYQNKKAELDQINALTNPSVKRNLLRSFADGADASAVHLKAAALPRQNNRVLIPIENMKDNEVYSPSHRNGETVALVRHPHGGIFEIPELVVNNRHATAKQMLGQAKDAIGINANVAQRLSGADFDGDTVLVIPNDSGAVRTSPSLKGLQDFDPQRAYPNYDGMKVMSKIETQKQMGEVSNLITDMTIKGATQTEIARAVRHSMVVIDAEKHKLNYKQSAIDNGISQLKAKYQSDPNNPGKAGASTLISRSSSTIRVPARRARRASEGGPINEDGSLAWTPTGESYTNRKGEVKEVTTKTTRMAEASDARELSSGLPMDEAYATHANNMKSLANEARRVAQQTNPTPRTPSAAATHKVEVDSLKAKLNTALRNAPLERQAQILGNAVLEAKERAYPEMTKEERRKIKGQALQEARYRTDAGKQRVDITDKEWEAIQAGAVSPTMLESILNNSDLDRVKELATPRSNYGMTPALEARARAMVNNGYTQSEVAEALGVSPSTIAAL